MGQPLWVVDFSPARYEQPDRVGDGAREIGVTSRLKADYPDYAERLRLVASNQVASGLFLPLGHRSGVEVLAPIWGQKRRRRGTKAV